MIRDYLAMLLPYALGVMGGLIMGIPIGRIQGAERVKRGCCERPPRGEEDRFPKMTRAQLNAVTGVQCSQCWRSIGECRCPMRARRGSA